MSLSPLQLAALVFLAQNQAPAGGSSSPLISMLIPMALIFVVIYFMMIKPQRKQQRERDDMVKNLKKNDHVITSAGIFGIVDKVKDNEVILKIDEKSDVRMRVAKSAIVGIEKASGAEEKKPEEEKSQKK